MSIVYRVAETPLWYLHYSKEQIHVAITNNSAPNADGPTSESPSDNEICEAPLSLVTLHERIVCLQDLT